MTWPGGDGVVFRSETPANGVLVVVQGLHYAGPDDARMDRFCRILAHAGIICVAPNLHSFRRLRVADDTAGDVARAFDHAEQLATRAGLAHPGMFSISFGSMPALSVAGDPAYRDRLSGLMLFGGFFEFRATVRFAVSKRAFAPGAMPIDAPHDPLNVPAVLINVLPFIEAHGARAPLHEAWLDLAKLTWGRPERRAEQARLPVAASLAASLPLEQRDLFWIGSGLRPGAAALFEVGIANDGGHYDFTDPSADLANLRAPLVVVHGRDDDVIPWTEALKLGARCRSATTFITGLYGHTGSHLPTASEVGHELSQMWRFLHALVDLPRAVESREAGR